MTEKQNTAVANVPEIKQMENSLVDLVSALAGNGVHTGVQLSQTDTLSINNRWYMISNNRTLLSQLYVEHGIVQTLIDQPVDDGFRAGFEIKTSQLDANDLEKLMIYCERHKVIQSLAQAVKWARLYGGGAVMIITGQNPQTPLDVSQLKEDSPVAFRAVDMWELYYSRLNVNGEPVTVEDDDIDSNMGDFYDYYGHRIHRSRVYRIEGKQAPSFVRPRLRGWGMSELERLVRSINQYMKNQDVVFELLDEAKVDVFKMKGFNSALLTREGTAVVSNRVQGANMIKNYLNALTMDKDDEYEQKQIAFTGLSEVLLQIRQGIAADLKMPMSKIFGISAAGFNSGEDDIENYNSMIEGEIRSKTKFIVVDLLNIACQKLFGFIPDDLMISWNPLRIMGADQEEKIKDSQFNRVMAAYSSGLILPKETKEMLNKDSLLPSEVDETDEVGEPLGGDYTVGGDGGDKGDNAAKDAKEKP